MTSPDPRFAPPPGVQAAAAVCFARHPDQGALEALKWLAVLSMLIDHVGALMLEQHKFSASYQVGRLAYPLFAMVLACRLAMQVQCKGALGLGPARRLLAWALLSAVPFALATGRVWPPDIFFTLALGAALCWLSDADYPWLARFGLHMLAVVASLGCDYFTPGVYLVPVMYRMQRRPSLGLALGLLVCAVGLSFLNASSVTLLAFALLMLAHGLRLRWPRMPGLTFYALYPLHLTALATWRFLH